MSFGRENTGKQALAVSGMTCSSCARAVERALLQVPGVRAAAVDLAKRRAVVEGDARAEALVAAVEAAGYEAKPLADEALEEKADERRRSGCC